MVAQAKRVLEFFSANGATQFTFDEALIGGAAYDATGTPFPSETLAKAKAADAILLGAVGGPQWEALDYSVRPERGLLGIRKELDLFANLRPAICFDALADASTLKREVVAGLDILIVRELTGDIYFGKPRGVTTENGHRIGRNTMIYADWEVQRIARVALDLARARGKKLCSVDKANVLECTEMWREEVQKLRDAEYTDIALSHMYVDNAAMQLVRNPKQFDVVVHRQYFRRYFERLCRRCSPARSACCRRRRWVRKSMASARRCMNPCTVRRRISRGKGRGESDRDDSIGGDDAAFFLRAA